MALVVYQSQQFVVKLNVLCDLPGTEVSDLVSDHSGNVVSHTEGERTGQTSQVKQSQHHNHFDYLHLHRTSHHRQLTLRHLRNQIKGQVGKKNWSD